MFDIDTMHASATPQQIEQRLLDDDYLIAILISNKFSGNLKQKADYISDNALVDFGVKDSIETTKPKVENAIEYFYQPALEQSFRASVEGALRSCIQVIENKLIVNTLYVAMSSEEMPEDLEKELLEAHTAIKAIPATKDDARSLPNATQHNVPAWTIFAMFFMVMSLGSSLVREKLNGSFVRLKTMPTNFLTALFSKQIVYMIVAIIQLVVIFSLGIWLFPTMDLPKLYLPSDLFALTIVSLLTAWCAVNYASAVGVLSETLEQANGYGAVSVVILAAIGGIMVPAFAMPPIFKYVMLLSPLHWCLEAYYGLFLEGGGILDIWSNVLFLVLITIALLAISIFGLKKKNLI